jgi:hypothetical protein
MAKDAWNSRSEKLTKKPTISVRLKMLPLTNSYEMLRLVSSAPLATNRI